MARKYEQIWEGKWIRWARKTAFQCCDCGMVHTISLRIRGGKIEVRMDLDNRATAAIRRAHGIEIKKNK